jgi:simple sugar transport system permease protein
VVPADGGRPRRWIAIALVIFDRRRPWCALAGALLFGGIESLVPGSPPRASTRQSISC